MSVIESVVVGLFCLFIVFMVLAVLYGMVILLSAALKAATGGKVKSPEAAAEPIYSETAAVGEKQTAEGKLQLLNVDDKTAATVMAIVSFESGIPLEELNFKYIKALDK